MKNFSKRIFPVLVMILIGISAKAQDKQAKVKTAEFKVYGVCEMCENRIENAASIKGVKQAEWDVETKLIKVVYKPSKTTEDQIHESIAEVGYTTSKIEANKKAKGKLPKCCSAKSCGTPPKK